MDAAGWNDFGSRMYWADLGRWFVTDPQRQFGSPYLALGNIPTLGVDPNGEFVFLFLLLLAHSVWFVETRTRVFVRYEANQKLYLIKVLYHGITEILQC